MKELFDLSFSAANALSTGLFVFSLMYWFVVAIGFFDFDSMDLDLDLDLDLDADVDTDMEISASNISWFTMFLKFLGLSKVPLMIWVFFLAISAWIISVSVNYIFGFDSFLMGTLVFIGAIFPSAVVAKYASYPFGFLYSKLKDDDLKTHIIGRVGEVKLPGVNGEEGQVIIEDQGRKHIVSYTSDLNLDKGESVLVVDHKQDTDLYIVEPYNNN